MNVRDLAKMSLCVALLVVSSWIAFPLPLTPTPVTAQTLMVNVLALILTPTQAFLTVLSYLLIGVLGFPVFSGGNSGIAVLLSPNGGFILSFLVVAPLLSMIRGNEVRSFFMNLGLTVLIGMPIIYVIGMGWMSQVMHMDLVSTFMVAVAPFIVGDMLKCIMACVVVARLQAYPALRIMEKY